MSSSCRIFLASSSELAAERAALEIAVNRRNKLWHADGIFLHLAIWEDFIDTVSRTRKQDDYDAAVRGSDLFVILVHHRLGKYSAEEFTVAYDSFMEHGTPRILVYLKDPPAPRQPDPGEHYDTVRAFRQRLGEIDHFPTPYTSAPELLLHFNGQLDKLRADGLFAPDKSPPPVNRSTAGATSFRGSGAQAMGDRAQAASNRGVNIGGNQTGEVRTGDTHIHTGGGAYLGGPVTVKHGPLVGRDHHQTHLHPPGGTAMPEADALADALHRLREVIERQATEADQSLAAEILDELAAESAKPAPERSDGRMARLVDGLVDLIPAGAKAMAGTLLGPVLAGLAGPLTSAVLDKLLGRRIP